MDLHSSLFRVQASEPHVTICQTKACMRQAFNLLVTVRDLQIGVSSLILCLAMASLAFTSSSHELSSQIYERLGFLQGGTSDSYGYRVRIVTHLHNFDLLAIYLHTQLCCRLMLAVNHISQLFFRARYEYNIIGASEVGDTPPSNSEASSHLRNHPAPFA